MMSKEWDGMGRGSVSVGIQDGEGSRRNTSARTARDRTASAHIPPTNTQSVTLSLPGAHAPSSWRRAGWTSGGMGGMSGLAALTYLGSGRAVGLGVHVCVSVNTG